MRALLRCLGRFGRDQRGNVAVIFAITAIPLLAAVGCAVDYSTATRIKAQLQSAADAASVGSLAVGSPAYVAAGAMGSAGPVPEGVTDATNIFDANINGLTGFTDLQVSPTVTKTNTNLTSKVTFSAQVPTVFVKLIGYPTLTVSGSSQSSGSLPMYLDFYLALDVSGSMGLPSTPSEAQRMQAINPDNWVQYRTGCTLACHFAAQNSACVDPPVTPPTNPDPNPPSNTWSYTQEYATNSYCMGYIYSRLSQSALSNLIKMASTRSVRKQVPGLPDAMLPNLNNSLSGPNSLITGNSASTTWSLPAVSNCPTPGTDSCIQLRLDAVGYAVNQLFQTANQDEKLPDQFRIGLYPFIRYLDSGYSPLTSSINGDPSTPGTINYDAANLATLLDTNANSNLGSGGTHIDNALSSLNTVVASVGNGSASNDTLPYIFLVTDGAEDPQVKGVPNGGWSGSNHATVIDPTTDCTPIKNRGIIISVLYIPYQQISPVNASFANDEDDYANANIPNIPASLQACASPGFFYTANTPQDITAALQQMFNHALITAHLTN
ncbi:MAG: TadE/TadG family type IV pilus assembly protein [Bradyrhizobium sp.]